MEASDLEVCEESKEHQEKNISENSEIHCNSVEAVADVSKTVDSEPPSNNLNKSEMNDNDVLCKSSEKDDSVSPSPDCSDKMNNSNNLPLVDNSDDKDDPKVDERKSLIDKACENDVSSVVNNLIHALEEKGISTSTKPSNSSSSTFQDAVSVCTENELLSNGSENTKNGVQNDKNLILKKNECNGIATDDAVTENEFISIDTAESETSEPSSTELINEDMCNETKSKNAQSTTKTQEQTDDTKMCVESESAEKEAGQTGNSDSSKNDDAKCDESDDSIEIIEINEDEDSSSEEDKTPSVDKDCVIVDPESELPEKSHSKNNASNHLDDKQKSVNNSEPLDMSVAPIEEDKLDVENTAQKKNTESLSEACTNLQLAESSDEVSASKAVVNKKTTKRITFEPLSDEETGFPSFLKEQVTIGRYDPVMGDFTLKGTEALIECPSLTAPFLVKEPDVFPPSESKSPENMGFFNSSAGNFLIGIGFSRVREWYHRDMSRIKSRRIKKSGRTDELIQELKNHQTQFLQAKKANEHFGLPYMKCKVCDYVTESSIVLEGHMLTPHVTERREYLCSFCSYLHRDPKEMLGHMKTAHNKTGRIEPPSLAHECICCIFETNSRVKLNSHLGRCCKYFNESKNQCPTKDIEFPCLTPKPITVSIVKSYEKSISSVMPSRGRPRKNDSIIDYFNPQSNFYGSAANQFRPMMSMPLTDGLHNQQFPRVDQLYSNANNVFNAGLPPLHHMGNNLLHGINLPFSPQYPQPTLKKAKKSFISPSYGNNSMLSGMHQFGKSTLELPPGVPQPPRLQGPYPAPASKDSPSPNIPQQPNNLVVCEICDGYIKDLEQLRMHMQLIHKVKIHPKMLTSRPPLNCQKCLWRFFTDHGLERHLLGAHGLVTSNMQELANNNKDTGCCTICGRVYASKLVSHMNQIHKIPLKPAHLSYKCTVCSATFGLYRLFENHVYLVHAGGTKRPSSENSPIPKKSLKLSHSEKN